MEANAWILTLHLLTLHESPDMHTATPGVSLTVPSGATLGTFRNSLGRRSVMLGYTAQTEDARWGVTAGAVSGYSYHNQDGLHHRWVPLVVPSYRVPLTEHTGLRLAYLYGKGSALHLAIDTKF